MMSDFEMPPLNEELEEIKIKQNKTHLYALSVHKQSENTYLNVCNKFEVCLKKSINTFSILNNLLFKT